MKFAFGLLLMTLLAGLAMAAGEPQKPVIVSYPADTPQSVLDEAMDAIKKAGGIITHEYTIIKGFAAKACEAALDTVQALGTQNNVIIEEDQIMHTETH